MIKIRALRQFSHYHAGNFSQFEVREVKDEYAEALIGLALAEEVDADPIQEQEIPAANAPKKAGGKK